MNTPMSPVLTRSYANARHCTNAHETVLTVTGVTRKGIRRLFSLPTHGDPRVEAQPLIIPNVKLVHGLTHDIAILATMSNDVIAYDAQDGTLLWKTNLGHPVTGNKGIDNFQINILWGILSTPVVDPDTNTLYAVSWSSPDGSVNKATHSIHALDLTTGQHAHPALSLEGASYDPGHGLPIQRFVSLERKQRSGLLLTNVNGVKTVIIGCGSIAEDDGKARGWVIAVDAAAFKITAAYAAAARFSGGGIWQGAQGIAADSKGFLYCMTGNGAFDGKTEWGECFLKMQYTPPAHGHDQGKITVVDWFAPFSDTGRDGRDPTLPSLQEGGPGRPSNFNSADDMDLGSGGPVCIEEFNIIAGAGKDGILYVMDSDKMGQTANHDFANPAANYAKLKSPPIWFTFFPGFGVSAAPQDITTLNQNFFGLTHHQHSTPIVYDSPIHGKMLFNWGENGNLRAWSIDATGKVTFLANGAEVASPQAPIATNGGMPGGMISLSCNGATPGTGLVWALVPVKDANKDRDDPGILYCYDADNFDTFPDGSKRLRLLWNSADWNLTFTHPKFNVPVVSGGKVFVPTYDGRVDVYG